MTSNVLTQDQIAAEKATKPRPDLFPARAILAGGRAFAKGLAKHGGGATGRGTFRDAGTPQAEVSTHIASLFRHLLQWQSGQPIDPDTGLSHLDCAIAQLAVVIDLVEDPPKAEVLPLYEYPMGVAAYDTTCARCGDCDPIDWMGPSAYDVPVEEVRVRD